MGRPHLSHTSRVRVDSAGRIVIPSEIRSRHSIEPGQDLILSERPDGLHVQTFRHLLAEAQAFFAPYAVPGQSIVDELIRERREDAKREEDE
jgi:AbrB family looped-hinge helix DNA binding protein